MIHTLYLFPFLLFPFFPPDKSHPFNQKHPFHFLLSLSRHFPSLHFFSVPSLLFFPLLTHSPSLLLFLSSHGESALAFFPPSYLPSSLSVFAIIFVLEIKLNYLPAHSHARCVTPQLRNAHISSTLCPSCLPFSFPPHFLTSSLMLGLLSTPLFRLPLSLSLPLLPLHESCPLIFLQCVTILWIQNQKNRHSQSHVCTC